MVAGILDEPFGARFETDALEPWQRRALCDLRLDGPEADLTVHLGGDSTRGRLPVRRRRGSRLEPGGSGVEHGVRFSFEDSFLNRLQVVFLLCQVHGSTLRG